MAGPEFMDLPAEIQTKIVQLAIPPMVLAEYLFMDGKIGINNERDATSAIMATCHKFRNLLLKARPLTGRNSTGQVFTFDSERDALLVMGMNIPDSLKTPQVPNIHAQYGTQPEHRRADLVLGDLNHPVHHTGLRWTNPRLDDYDDIEEIPIIGLHGYSKTRRDWRSQRSQEFSQGGQWAGFRVYLESEEVEFRPLTWDEVEPIIHREQQLQNGRQLLGNQDLELVSRDYSG
ncbi:Uncharacterized protein Y057_11878 [Fusarium fujikuroi]|nr:Uncharacterized protein Y057_11878 [Fusarium fujikuroi]